MNKAKWKEKHRNIDTVFSIMDQLGDGEKNQIEISSGLLRLVGLGLYGPQQWFESRMKIFEVEIIVRYLFEHETSDRHDS